MTKLNNLKKKLQYSKLVVDQTKLKRLNDKYSQDENMSLYIDRYDSIKSNFFDEEYIKDFFRNSNNSINNL